MRILLVDDCDITSELMRIYLEDEMPDVEVTEYDVRGQGRPGRDFDWSAYDALLLDYNLGNGETGIGWLESLAAREDLPPTVLITAAGDPYVVARAVQAGADGYLNKTDLSPQSLSRIVHDVVQGRVRAGSASIRARSAEPGDIARASDPEVVGADTATGASYKFGQLIGEGGMARAYLAERVDDGATVVIKVMDRSLAADDDNVRRFIQEGELAACVRSPHVVRVYDRGVTNSYAYIAMEFFGRGDLKPRISSGLAPETAVLYLQHIAEGLRAIHEVGIVHRDLKPSNVMFRGDDSMALVDFGIAKRIGTNLEITHEGEVVGSPCYLSPEQALGDPVDERSDLYGVGVLFYEMLTGAVPYSGESLSAVLFQHVHIDVPTVGGTLTRFDPIIAKLLAKEPADRYRNADELLAALSAPSLAA